MGSITIQNDTSSSDEGAGKRDEIEMQIRKRGIRKYIKNIRAESEDETDMETLHEKKEILMTEIEYILDTLLTKESARRIEAGGKTSKKGEF